MSAFRTKRAILQYYTGVTLIKIMSTNCKLVSEDGQSECKFMSESPGILAANGYGGGRAKTGWFRIGLMCTSGATCCFSELALKTCWSSKKRTSLSSHEMQLVLGMT